MDYSHLFKAIGEVNRLNIIRQLASGEKCVCKIYEKLGLSQNLTSHHLSILRKNGLITARKEGKWVYYSLNQDKIEELKRALEMILLTKKGKSKC